MIWYFILFHILSFPKTEVNTKTTILNFDIILKDKVVGELQASRSNKDSEIHYKSITNIKTRFITEINVDYKYNVVFNDNSLKKADVIITVNNKTHAETTTKWLGNHYSIIENEKAKVFNASIDYSTILMYFEEPKGVSHCFSEEDGTLNIIKSLGNHTYKKINSKGKENIYYYKNGKLTKAEIDGGLINFQMIAK
ncbi:hypothetical protein Q4512_04300 [Oceanihabitans sp. 2_MG-2023]|uniref:DUF6134 family protein n=1 Tax=Oceanihabitans sp. 2_MG-2023 TaxID=3062661 RepID=UPI0026E18D2D|nr:DUF6134 family protein [Oceanihabitans sp. 2_MG-2023]MDO6596124.1 hypothetical protein [Oceanihabitans sp. 2_MG-2023]